MQSELMDAIGALVRAHKQSRDADQPMAIPYGLMPRLAEAYDVEKKRSVPLDEMVDAALRDAVVSGRGDDAVHFQTLIIMRKANTND